MAPIHVAPRELPETRTERTVESIMTPVVRTVPPDTSLERAIHLFAELDIRHMVVAGDDGRIAGVFSAGEALRRVSHGTDAATTPVADILRGEALFVRPQTAIKDAIDLLIFNRIHCLPVLRDDRTVCGIVTTTNLLGALYEMLEQAERSVAA